MPGEKILVIDDSTAIQEIIKNTLEEQGFKVTIASNGLAALYHNELSEFDLIILDSTLDGVEAPTITRILKTDNETNPIPILLLIPEDEGEKRASQSLRGANAYLLKPFIPQQLIAKVNALIEERQIYEQSRKHLREAADRYMAKVAEKHIEEALELKTQLIVEKVIQQIVSMVDQRARKEVEEKITSLTAEKEQELVRMTVHEVAKAMVEKLAERKVNEAMDTILVEQTERTVKQTTESLLPTMIRERIRETLDNVLPREIQSRVQKAITEQVPDISNKIVQIVENAAQRTVPKVARERLPQIIERQFSTLAVTNLPKVVKDLTQKELSEELPKRLDPVIEETTRKIKLRVNIVGLLLLIAVLIFTVANVFISFVGVDKLPFTKTKPKAKIERPVSHR
ncbi:response regulator [Candidatus Sumerlaeota bacterium]|nr:response regulator [Candidatus Sumerlaeota bacterium]